jgi:integrase
MRRRRAASLSATRRTRRTGKGISTSSCPRQASSRAAIMRPCPTPTFPLSSPSFAGGRRRRRALEFALTAARTGEALAARWDEIDFDAKVWTVPAGRTKAAREHRVPLSDRTLAIVKEMEAGRAGDFVFPGLRPGRPLSGMAFEMLLRRVGPLYTAHGFRSSFRDWAGNETHFPRELAEHALANAIGDKAEQANRRSDALARRRELMDAWARHCEGAGGKLLEFKRPA